MRSANALGLLAVALAAGCATAPAKGPAPAPAAAAAPAPAAATSQAPAALPDDNLDAVLWSQRAIEHDLVFLEVYHSAEQKLLIALKDPQWDALPKGERKGSAAGLAPAVIVDIDETVLDNSPYQVELIRGGTEYDEFGWARWCRKEAARPLPGAVEFANFAVKQGVTVYYLSNRAKDLAAPTVANLRKAGFPVATDDLFLGLGTFVPGCEMVGTDKGCRRRLVGEKHRVLMQLGDQIGDFVDVVANTYDGRAREMAPYASWIGERWWMLPNPTYGPWVPAAFGNDWTQPRDKRRQSKIDALRVVE